MKRITLMIFSIFLNMQVFAGPEEVTLNIGFSACQENDINLEINCEHYDYVTDQITQCHFSPLYNKTITSKLIGDTYIDVYGTCNGRKRHCNYHFKPSKMRNVKYPDELATEFPNPQNLIVYLIAQPLPILKVDCN